MITASAPAGNGAPVITFQVVPACTGELATAPASTVPSTVNRTGRSGAAARTSAERTAYPSTLLLSNGGTAVAAETSAASTQPAASATCSSAGDTGGQAASS